MVKNVAAASCHLTADCVVELRQVSLEPCANTNFAIA